MASDKLDSEQEELQWQQWLANLRDGEDRACQKLWDEYGPLIERVAAKHLSPGIRRRVGPESVMISACRTFFRRVQDGEFKIDDAQSLWRLLCAITVNKARLKARYHNRKRRAVSEEIRAEDAPESAAAGFTSADVVAFEDQLQHVLCQLDETEQRVIELRLQQHTLAEIAERIGSSERTVRRMNKRLETKLLEMLDVSG